MKTITEITETVGATRADISNWMVRLELRTPFEPTVAGRAQRFSKENVLELALIAAFVKAGTEPRRAVALADSVMRERHEVGMQGRAAPARAWRVSFADDFSSGFAVDDLDLTTLLRKMKDVGGAPVIKAVCVAEVMERVDGLFAEVVHG